MALSAEDKAEIVKIIKESVSGHCWLESEAQKEMRHLVGRLCDFGDGNLNRGVETFAKAISLVNTHRKWGAKIGGAIAIALSVSGALGLAGWMLSVAWMSIKKALMN